MTVHPGLAWLRATPEGLRWLDELPRLVEVCRRRWSLQFYSDFDGDDDRDLYAELDHEQDNEENR